MSTLSFEEQDELKGVGKSLYINKGERSVDELKRQITEQYRLKESLYIYKGMFSVIKGDTPDKDTIRHLIVTTRFKDCMADWNESKTPEDGECYVYAMQAALKAGIEEIDGVAIDADAIVSEIASEGPDHAVEACHAMKTSTPQNTSEGMKAGVNYFLAKFNRDHMAEDAFECANLMQRAIDSGVEGLDKKAIMAQLESHDVEGCARARDGVFMALPSGHELKEEAGKAWLAADANLPTSSYFRLDSERMNLICLSSSLRAVYNEYQANPPKLDVAN